MKKFLLLATVGAIAFLPCVLSAADVARVVEPKEGQEYRVARLTACCTSIDSVKHIRDFTASATKSGGHMALLLRIADREDCTIRQPGSVEKFVKVFGRYAAINYGQYGLYVCDVDDFEEIGK